MKKIIIVAILGSLAMSACSLKKDTHKGGSSSDPTDTNVTEQDWDVSSSSSGGVDRVVKTLKASKLEAIRNAFRSPDLFSMTFAESNGFQIYHAKGLNILENIAFIHPKLFISTSTDRGSILGYKTGEKNEAGEDLVSISVPVALVNGLVSSIPLIGGAGTSAAISLPDKYKIPNKDALTAKVSPKSLDTLPVCPKVFRLVYHEKEYRALSPFTNLSTCPVNQFFRVIFKAPTEEMRRLLEAAALQDEAVTMIADFSVEFATPKIATEIDIDNSKFFTVLKANTSLLEPKGQTVGGDQGYAIEDIEGAVIDSVFQIIRETGQSPEYSTGMPRVVSTLIDGYYGLPFTCQKGGICMALKKRATIQTAIHYSWTVAESLSTPIETQEVIGLGAVANTSAFESKPSWSVFDYGQKPKWFGGKTVAAIIAECDGLDRAKYPVLPGMDAEEAPYIQGYCKGMLANAKRNNNDPEETDGYYPLGANTTVYPGAWLRIDLDEIAEFTTAKTKVDKDGNSIIESEVKDMLSLDPTSPRTSCVEGNQVACEQYALKEIAVRDSAGDQVFSDMDCKKGDDGCVCAKKDDGTETCLKKQYQFQKVMDYTCDLKDQYETCPYYRTQDDVIDYEREWDCQLVQIEKHTPFLCIGGCSEKNEVQCNLKSQKPISAKRQYLNCKEDDPKGTASHELMCRRPQYLCERWATRCSRYSVNEAFQIIHENVAPNWRPFALSKGEYPRRFEDQLFLKFVSPKGTVSECRLDKFGRFFRGNTLFIKIPTEKNEDQPCGVPLWNPDNSRSLFLPKVYIKNNIAYEEKRLCGRTEYSFLTEEVPISGGKSVVPVDFQRKTKTHIGPVANSCRAANPVPIGSDYWFSEVPPIRISGRVSVLGRVLESIVSGDNP